MLENKLKRPCQ